MQEVTTAAAPWNGVCPPPQPEMDITTAGAGLTSPSASTTSESSPVSFSPRSYLEATPEAGSQTSKDGHGVQTEMRSSASSRINEKGGVQAPGTPTQDQVLGSPFRYEAGSVHLAGHEGSVLGSPLLQEKGDGWGDVDEGRRLLEERTPILTVSGVTLANNEQNLESALYGDIYMVAFYGTDFPEFVSGLPRQGKWHLQAVRRANE